MIKLTIHTSKGADQGCFKRDLIAEDFTEGKAAFYLTFSKEQRDKFKEYLRLIYTQGVPDISPFHFEIIINNISKWFMSEEYEIVGEYDLKYEFKIIETNKAIQSERCIEL